VVNHCKKKELTPLFATKKISLAHSVKLCCPTKKNLKYAPTLSMQMKWLLLIFSLLFLTGCAALNACIDADCEPDLCRDGKIYEYTCHDNKCQESLKEDCTDNTRCSDSENLKAGDCAYVDGAQCVLADVKCADEDSRYECYEKDGNPRCTIPPDPNTITYVDDDTPYEPKEEVAKPCTTEQTRACSYSTCEDDKLVYYGCIDEKCVPGQIIDCKEQKGQNSNCFARNSKVSYCSAG